MSLNIVFMGTPEFSVPTLQALIKKNFNISNGDTIIFRVVTPHAIWHQMYSFVPR